MLHKKDKEYLVEFIKKYGYETFHKDLKYVNDEEIVKKCSVLDCSEQKNIFLPDLSLLPNLKIINITNCNLEEFPKLPDNITTILAHGNNFKYLPKLPKKTTYIYIDDTIEFILNEPRDFINIFIMPEFLTKDINLYYAKSFNFLVEKLLKNKKDNNYNKEYFEDLKKLRRLITFIEKHDLQFVKDNNLIKELRNI